LSPHVILLSTPSTQPYPSAHIPTACPHLSPRTAVNEERWRRGRPWEEVPLAGAGAPRPLPSFYAKSLCLTRPLPPAPEARRGLVALAVDTGGVHDHVPSAATRRRAAGPQLHHVHTPQSPPPGQRSWGGVALPGLLLSLERPPSLSKSICSRRLSSLVSSSMSSP
jgi:hypothetical protein